MVLADVVGGLFTGVAFDRGAAPVVEGVILSTGWMRDAPCPVCSSGLFCGS